MGRKESNQTNWYGSIYMFAKVIIPTSKEGLNNVIEPLNWLEMKSSFSENNL